MPCMNLGLLAIIGGTGVDLNDNHSPLRDARREIVRTRWGTTCVTRATLANREILFLQRHAAPPDDADSFSASPHMSPHAAPLSDAAPPTVSSEDASLEDASTPGSRTIPPHRVNYRANIAALKQLGATAIFASTAVGSLRPEWRPGTLVCLDQFLDWTTNRAKTFFDDRAVHIDMTEPYCARLRSLLLLTANDLNLSLEDGGTYACTDGPRFETPAEIRAYARLGADLVGMTGVPEAVLAREANISYAGVSVVTNLAAGISPQPLTQAEVMDAMRVALPQVAELFLAAAQSYEDDPKTQSRRATEEFGWPSIT